ncbi:Vacuolar protein sorting-associated protein 37B [Acropora cervicornis]|uniref:Vacuolar protein sorting-associated protein 37B n=1 Tax=Acropora cervicornis TaxID=6130 RepID=A0AAD9V1T4_ACRCE|nr:Vacuolar protein sorting-associated protein 37B [Acropora cervicornis]
MSGIYGLTSFVNGPQLNEAKALQEIMSLLQHIDKGELQELLNNEGQINDLISDNEEVKRIGIHHDTVMASNRSLAEYNLSQQPVLERKKQMLIEAYQNKTLIQVEFDKNQQTLETLSSQYSPDTTLALLQASAQQAEDEAEKTADKFMDGEINVDEFIQTFQSQKTTHHLRKIKSEKLSELLRTRRPSQYSYRY